MADSDQGIFSALAEHRCPDCGGTKFRPGPWGGLSQNIECEQCKRRFNVTWYRGQLVFADRIPSRGDGPDWLPPDRYEKIKELMEMLSAIAEEIGHRVADDGQRPETWLTDESRGRIVAGHALSVLVEKGVKT